MRNEEPTAGPCVHASDHSIAAGRDVNVRLDCLDTMQGWLAEHADDPDAMHCDWCGLRGMPHATNACLVCGNDVGKERRARERMAAAKQRWHQLWSNTRLLMNAAIALLIVGQLVSWYPRALGNDFNTAVGGMLLVMVLAGCLEYICLRTLVWLQYDVPRWLRKHGLEWLLRK